jgi:integrase
MSANQTASLAHAIWSNFASTKYPQVQRSGTERQSFKKKTGRPVQFEITEQTRTSLEIWLLMLRTTGSRYLFPSRLHARPHLSTRQYSRIVHRWVDSIGLESISYGTHSIRRTKATHIYRRAGNLRAVQLFLGHIKLESTVRYLGIEVDDALQIAEQSGSRHRTRPYPA